MCTQDRSCGQSSRGIRTGRKAPDTFRALSEELKKHPRASLLLLRRVSEESVWARRMGTLSSPRDLRCAFYVGTARRVRQSGLSVAGELRGKGAGSPASYCS